MRGWAAAFGDNSSALCARVRRRPCMKAPSDESLIAMKPTSKRRRVAVLAVPPVEELDLIGPMEVFATANRLVARDAYRVELATNARNRQIEGASGLPLRA